LPEGVLTLPNTDREIFDLLLELVPQKEPFRFIDQIVSVSDEKIVAKYTYKPDEWFYPGHFPGNPITPGVIMIETMAQTAVVAFGIYLMLKEGTFRPNEYLTVFTDVVGEFAKQVKPGETVTIEGERIFWRRMKLKSKANLYLGDGSLVASATLSGVGVKR
jgi:3-hydroxyacyl-[acyl-carrier-protein] dehydratase